VVLIVVAAGEIEVAIVVGRVAVVNVLIIIISSRCSSSSIRLVVNSDAGCTNSNSERNNESRRLMDTTVVDLETLMTGTF
jgi:hypothetical protein